MDQKKVKGSSSPSESQLNRLFQTKQLELNSLLEVTQAINNNLPIDALFRIYEFILRAQMGIKRLTVFISEKSDDATGRSNDVEVGWNCVCNFGTDDKIKELDVDKELLKYKKTTDISKSKVPLLEGFSIVMPVYHKERPLAYSLVATEKTEDKETYDENIRFLQTITNIIVVAVENKKLFKRQLEQEGIKKELELAAQMQTMLIPTELPRNKVYELAAVYLPNQEVGGDYYDFIPLNHDEFIFCVADISGKGVAAALLMANFQATLRAMVKQPMTAEQFFKVLNRNVNQITKGDKFITMFMGKYHIKSRKLLYVNAGHNPPVLFSDNKIKILEKGTTILGMFDRLPFIHVGEERLKKGTMIVNYTDGLTDLENEENERFEIENLISFIRKNSELDIEKFNDSLIDYINKYRGKKDFNDDITLLSCRFL